MAEFEKLTLLLAVSIPLIVTFPVARILPTLAFPEVWKALALTVWEVMILPDTDKFTNVPTEVIFGCAATATVFATFAWIFVK